MRIEASRGKRPTMNGQAAILCRSAAARPTQNGGAGMSASEHRSEAWDARKGFGRRAARRLFGLKLSRVSMQAGREGPTGSRRASESLLCSSTEYAAVRGSNASIAESKSST